ncbi:spliceosome-associated protein CWC27 homolog [Ptychodera flava]|uniref:spliceosome-associated protein CWC27 homolog n=1 Tax=Ptychodera flava TaxID=63121 RepID=UPI00396A9EA6
MSNIYIQEPPTNGKVLLKTTAGDIDIELWSKETPKACRNFVQLCMEGYYNGTIFHRVVHNFIIQGGDPTGTGEGGESIYGKPFKDEFHQRLRFNRRGMVGMANAGPNDNGSQFFFTLERSDNLNKKHTLFGKVVGNTVFNMLKLAEVETDPDERPLEPHKIKSVQILSNPFDDIIPRVISKKEDKKDKKQTSKSKATKNFSLLSFGEEAEEDEEESVEVSKDLKSKSKSAHDLTDDPRLSTVPAVQTSEPLASDVQPKRQSDERSEEEDDMSDEEYNEKMKEKIRKKLKKSEDENDVKKKEVAEEKSLSRSEQLKKESRQLKREMLEAKKKKEQEVEKETKDDEEEDVEEGNDALAVFRREKKKYAEKKKQLSKGSSREVETLAMLAKFQNRLQSFRQSTEGEEEKEEEEEDEAEDDENDIPTSSWLNHRLQFENHESKVKDANIQDEDTFAIFDPRNPINKRRREESKRMKKEKSERR